MPASLQRIASRAVSWARPCLVVTLSFCLSAQEPNGLSADSFSLPALSQRQQQKSWRQPELLPSFYSRGPKAHNATAARVKLNTGNGFTSLPSLAAAHYPLLLSVTLRCALSHDGPRFARHVLRHAPPERWACTFAVFSLRMGSEIHRSVRRLAASPRELIHALALRCFWAAAPTRGGRSSKRTTGRVMLCTSAAVCLIVRKVRDPSRYCATYALVAE